MFGNKLSQLVGVVVGTALSYGAMSPQLEQQAQAAVLTSNFEVSTVLNNALQGSYTGTFGGTFTFDDSSLTRQGQESLPLLSGVFNFVKAGRKENAYDLTNGKVNFLDGKFLGLSVQDRSVSEEVIKTYTIINQQGLPVTTELHGALQWSIVFYPTWGQSELRGFEGFKETPRFDRFFSGVVVYSEPVEVASVPVPEPTTVVGTALAIVGLAKLKRRKKACI